MTNNKLKKYECSFIGREVTAIGIFYRINYTVEAENEEQAEMKIYDKYDHLKGLVIREVK